jgi:hypothetical protein
VHGAGWRLVAVALDAGEVDRAALAWFSTIGGRVVVLDAPTDAWFVDHPVEWVLLRPDFHVYGTATTAAGASALLEDLGARLGASRPTPEGMRA